MRDLQPTKDKRMNWFVITELVANKCLLFIVNKHQFNLFMRCSKIIKWSS